MKPWDKIWILGIECRARLGVPDWERRRPQKILIDVGLECDTRAAARNDDFRVAVDYQKIERLVRQAAQSQERKLIETLAQTLATLILKSDKRLRAITIRLRKRPAVMPRVAEVVVEISRARRLQLPSPSGRGVG